MAYWKRLIAGGVDVDLAHLEPFEFDLQPNGWTRLATVRVAFNNHCFSEAFDAERHREVLPSTHVPSRERRAFDAVRYELSKLLPGFVRELDGRRIAQTRKGPLVRITLADGGNYGIFFTLRKSGHASCEMFVISAYPLGRPRAEIASTGEMKFNVAMALVLKGSTPKFPPR